LQIKTASFRNLTASLLIFLALVPVPLLAQRRAEEAERQLFDGINRERVSQGLPRLKWDDALAGAARQHAETMAARNMLSHQITGEPSLPGRATHAGVQFISLSENVAQGPSAADISDQWMRSPNNRANILDGDMDSAGIGIAERNGTLFAVADFCRVRR
jgi:uncharacterized protein YkwD